VLQVGLLADFAVLSADPATIPREEFGDLRVTMTVVGGRRYTQNDGSRMSRSRRSTNQKTPLGARLTGSSPLQFPMLRVRVWLAFAALCVIWGSSYLFIRLGCEISHHRH
jgi:hypothetical protein